MEYIDRQVYHQYTIINHLRQSLILQRRIFNNFKVSHDETDQNQYKQKMKANFRIICLKNDEVRKYRDEKLKNSNIMVTPNERKQKNGSESFIPNLVHLSARLQDDSNQEKRPQSHSYHHQSYLINYQQLSRDYDNQNFSHKRAEEINKQRQMQIVRFFQQKNGAIERQKNTMKNLLGSINFSPNKKKQKKISRLIKQTIKDVCGSQRSNRKFNSSENAIMAQNKTLLQSDFQNFLANKHQEISAPKQDNEEFKLKRLSIVNPEQTAPQSARPHSIQPLNLFHFLNQKSSEHASKQKKNQRNFSSSNVKAMSFFGQARIDKKIFNLHSNLKTQEQQFEWSKLKDKSNHKNFTLRTLDL